MRFRFPLPTLLCKGDIKKKFGSRGEGKEGSGRAPNFPKGKRGKLRENLREK